MNINGNTSVTMPGFLPKIASLIMCAAALLSSQAVYADTPDVTTMIENFAGTLPNLMCLVTAVAYVLGMWFIYEGIMDLKQFGEQRTQYSSHASLKGPLIRLTMGTLLLFLPSSVDASLGTFWQDAAPYAYVDDSDALWGIIVACIIALIQFVGTVSFIRGLIVLNRLAGHSAPHDAFSRGITHVIAGALCINIYGFVTAVFMTLGLGQFIQ